MEVPDGLVVGVGVDVGVTVVDELGVVVGVGGGVSQVDLSQTTLNPKFMPVPSLTQPPESNS